VLAFGLLLGWPYARILRPKFFSTLYILVRIISLPHGNRTVLQITMKQKQPFKLGMVTMFVMMIMMVSMVMMVMVMVIMMWWRRRVVVVLKKQEMKKTTKRETKGKGQT
jgi:hypothetical protein